MIEATAGAVRKAADAVGIVLRWTPEGFRADDVSPDQWRRFQIALMVEDREAAPA